MRTLLGTSPPQTYPDTFFPFARATTALDKQTLMFAHHEYMRARGLSPYNLLWPFEYDKVPRIPWSGLMDYWWDGGTFGLAPEMLTYLEGWRGHSLMLQHISSAAYNKTTLSIARARVDSPDFVARAAPFYHAAEALFATYGIKLYVMIDEPKVAVDASGRALPLAQQYNSTRTCLKIAEAVTKDSTIRVGPAGKGNTIPLWKELNARFNWWVVKNYGYLNWSGAPADVRPIVGDNEVWTYFTSATIMMPGNEAQMAPTFANARAMGATGVLLWTVFPYPDPNLRDTCALFNTAPAGNGFDPKVYPLQPKMDAFVAALTGVVTPLEPQTWQEAYAVTKARLDKAGIP